MFPTAPLTLMGVYALVKLRVKRPRYALRKKGKSDKDRSVGMVKSCLYYCYCITSRSSRGWIVNI